MIIKDVHDQIVLKYLDNPKIISFIIQNYYWLRLKKIV